MSWGFHWAAVDEGWHLAMEVNGADLGGTEAIEDLMASPPPSTEVGIAGATPTDLVASSGRFDFALNNDVNNSAGLLGYYSPEHANAREGFGIGSRVDFYYVTSDGTHLHKFCGWINVVDPTPGRSGPRVTICSALDWMNEAAKARLSIATQVSKRLDEILDEIIDESVSRPPIDTDFDTGDTTFEYAADQSSNEVVLSEIQRGAQSEYGRVFQRGPTLYFKNRSSFVTADVLVTLDDDFLLSMTAAQDGTNVYNRVFMTTHPRRVDAVDTTVLATNEGIPAIANGDSIMLVGKYVDPAQEAAHVGGTDMRDPVATTDYTANVNADGSGADLTSGFSVVAEYFSDSVRWTVTNNSGFDGYLTFLQARGRGLYSYNPTDVELFDQDSIDARGETSLSFDMPYQSDQTTAQVVGQFILDTWKDPQANAVEIGLMAAPVTRLVKGDAAGFSQDDILLRLGPGITMALMEEVTGVSSAFIIQQERLRVTPGGVVYANYLLRRVLTDAYWELGVAGRSELGETTIMAPL